MKTPKEIAEIRCKKRNHLYVLDYSTSAVQFRCYLCGKIKPINGTSRNISQWEMFDTEINI